MRSVRSVSDVGPAVVELWGFKDRDTAVTEWHYADGRTDILTGLLY